VRELPPTLSRAIEQGGPGLTVAVLRLSAMGDILRTLPPVRLLRRSLPEARIFWIAEDRWAGVLEGHPDLNGVLAVPRKRWSAALSSPLRWPSLPASVAAFRRELRSWRAGLLLDFHGNLRSGWIGSLSGAPVRLGYAGHQQKEGNRWFTTHRVASASRRTPRMERNLSLVAALGIDVSDLPPAALPLERRGRDEARRIREELGLEPGRFAVVSPGASPAQLYKAPPAELLAAACRRLERRGLAPLVVWGPGEEELARRTVERSGDGTIYAPPTSLAALAALTGEARLFVGGDSGPLHIACAVGCPVVGVYGPTDPRVNQPWGVPYRVVHPARREYTGIKRQDRGQGFEGLAPSDVARAVDELLDATAPGEPG
jgi:ADP-heptose:LPS heptosyltransferase